MIQLTSKTITDTTRQHLQGKQQDIDAKPDFQARSARGKTLWKRKRGSQAGQAAFDEIKTTLINMCVGVELCNYCENNEATDVEHVYPKDHFPESAFDWDNYLLACRTCNTDYKSNRFAIFDPENSATRVDVNGEPPNRDAAFINPRREDPLQFFWLNIRRGIFSVHPNLAENSRHYHKAEYTEQLMGLNARDALVQARKQAAVTYLDLLERYIRIKSAVNFDELEAVTNPLDVVDRQQSFTSEKNKLLVAIKQDILTRSHPTVWEELKRQRGTLPRTNQLFNQAPEALNW